ncbi:MAG TPA: SRPBCC family protein [Acidimicrobiales bacterium]|nr:SRPBCC family protein [Acidimicrobiales bacterium]
MPHIRVRARVPAERQRVWAALRDIASHVEWMDDALAIEFLTPKTEGVGTEFTCLTKVGPIQLNDHMTVTEWVEGTSVGISHRGVVSGTGRLSVKRRGRAGSTVTWDERLSFPWWLGGPLGGLVGRPVLTRVWKRNLANLAGRFNTGAA